ncbi:hypothetical protein ACTFIU_002555 [Dictyostelium citrinum]
MDKIEYNSNLEELERLLCDKTELTSEGYDYSNSSFYCEGTIETLMSVKIKDYDNISFPTYPGQLKEIIKKHAIRAPFGKGTKTVTDLNVRKVWEIDGSKVETTSSTWSNTMDTILKDVREKLSLVILF